MSKRHNLKFYIFGDSISYGQLVSSHQTWATVLAKDLSLFQQESISILTQNTGVNGNTTRQALERLYFDVTSHEPDIVMVQFGLNDCNYWETDKGIPRVSKSAFVANLVEIIEKVFANGAKHCILNTNHPTQKGDFAHIKKNYDQSNSEYCELIRVAYRNLKKEFSQITLIDVESEWNNYLLSNTEISLEDLLLPDKIHLSYKGHELYHKIIIPKTIDIIVNYFS